MCACVKYNAVQGGKLLIMRVMESNKTDRETAKCQCMWLLTRRTNSAGRLQGVEVLNQRVNINQTSVVDIDLMSLNIDINS